MSDDKELDVSKVTRIEAYYSHGMWWDIDDICKGFDLNKTQLFHVTVFLEYL